MCWCRAPISNEIHATTSNRFLQNDWNIMHSEWSRERRYMTHAVFYEYKLKYMRLFSVLSYLLQVVCYGTYFSFLPYKKNNIFHANNLNTKY